MTKMNWDRISVGSRISRGGSEPVRDWKTVETVVRVREISPLASEWIRCKRCRAKRKPESLERHQRKAHGANQANENKSARQSPNVRVEDFAGVSGSDEQPFSVDLVDYSESWDRLEYAASCVSSIVPRRRLLRKRKSFTKKQSRCSLFCYSDQPEALTFARSIIERLGATVYLTLRVEKKRPRGCADLVIYL